ncbi:OmpA family protein [Rhodoferax sp. 4810]|nr:OmpA family protein [Rhodoferax jenense]
MSSVKRDERKRFSGVLILGLFLLLAFAIAVVISPSRKAGMAKPVATVSAAAPVAAGDASSASVVVQNGVVKFYFASGKAELAAGAKQALASIVAGAAAGKQVAVSGFHDSTGNAARNAALAKQRAFAVRDALVALGVPVNKIELKKPVKMLASGSNDEARRVEVSLQ